jgi:hypothetical protein
MGQFELFIETKSQLASLISRDQIIASFFKDYPEVKSFAFDKTSEYDDNNYSDSTRLMNINGLDVNWDGEYVDEDNEVIENPSEEIKSKMVSEEASSACFHLMEEVSGFYDYGEWSIEQEDFEFQPINFKNQKLDILTNICNGVKNEEDLETILSWDSIYEKMRYIKLYCGKFGRLTPEQEYELFCDPDENVGMANAYSYAREINAKLSDKVFQYFVLDNMRKNKKDPSLDQYSGFAKNL